MRANKQAAHQRGLDAEKTCAEFLAAKGYRIIGTRMRTAGGEIDIVAHHRDTLVVVEVKARRRAEQSLEAITPAKQRRLARAAEALLAAIENGEIAGLASPLPPNMRFDVMAVCPGAPPFHLEDAWRP